MPEPTINATLIADNDKRLDIVRYDYGVRFKASVAVAKDDWNDSVHESEAEARAWIKSVQAKAARLKRTEHAFPVTYIVESHLIGAKVEPATLRGLNANDGEWKITTLAGKKKAVHGNRLCRDMTPETRADLAGLYDVRAETQKKINVIERDHKLDLPHTYGKSTVDVATKKDESMVRLFKEG